MQKYRSFEIKFNNFDLNEIRLRVEYGSGREKIRNWSDLITFLKTPNVEADLVVLLVGLCLVNSNRRGS